MINRVKIKAAVDFHGHLGPYLILGLLAGEYALKKLKCGKHFGLKVMASGTDKRPKSCLVDGLQLSTVATYGKGNIRRLGGKNISILFSSKESNKKIKLILKKGLIDKLDSLRGHQDSEEFALELAKKKPGELFNSQS